MLADLEFNLTVFVTPDAQTGTLYAYKVCDVCKVNRFGYSINGTLGTVNEYQSGSYRGFQAQLPYCKHLSVGAIWLSPGLEDLHLPFAEVYHGYGIRHFLRTERHFADIPEQADEELRALVGAASGGAQAPHNDALRLVHWRDPQGSPFFASLTNISNPSQDALVWPQELQQDEFHHRRGVPMCEDVICDCSSVKQLQTDVEAVQLIRAYQYVMKRFGCDGSRIDTLRYLQGDLPRLFGNAVRECGKKKHLYIRRGLRSQCGYGALPCGLTAGVPQIVELRMPYTQSACARSFDIGLHARISASAAVSA